MPENLLCRAPTRIKTCEPATQCLQPTIGGALYCATCIRQGRVLRLEPTSTARCACNVALVRVGDAQGQSFEMIGCPHHYEYAQDLIEKHGVMIDGKTYYALPVVDNGEELVVEPPKEVGEQVDHPKHYNAGKFEVIDVIEDWKLGFCLGNAVKYVARADHKGSKLIDLKKARWYLDREIQALEKESK